MNNTVMRVDESLPLQGQMSATGWNPPANMTYDQWRDAGSQLNKIEQARQWWIGDWWNAGVEWGKGEETCRDTGVEYQTARNCGSIAKSFEMSRRRDNLTFGHHSEVLSVKDKTVQDKFLDWCLVDENGLERDKPKSIRDLREAIRNYLDDLNWSDSERDRKDAVLSGETVIAHLQNDESLINWAKFEGCFQRIDRGSDWGNPFVIPGDGDRDKVCDKYGIYIDLKDSLLEKLPQMKGKVLGCWCHPERCHGEEIIKRL